MHAGNQRRIQLQQWLAAREYHVFAGSIGCRPQAIDRLRQVLAAFEFSTTLTIGTNEVGIAELAHRRTPIFLAATPEVATAEAAKDRRSTGVRTLALQGVKNFFNAIGHDE